MKKHLYPCLLALVFALAVIGCKTNPAATVQNATATVELPILSAKTGDIVSIPLTIKSSVSLAEAGAKNFVAKIRFNSSVLTPAIGSPAGVISGNDRVITVAGTRPDTLTQGAVAYLFVICNADKGNSTQLALDSFSFTDGSPVAITRVNGAVAITGNSQSFTTAPTGLKASSANSTEVHLTWTAPTGATAATSYYVSWTGPTSGSLDEWHSTSADVTGLNPGLYQFSIVAKDSAGNLSAADTLSWAPAARYSNDVNYNVPLQIFERTAIGVGSALTIDPSLGGPTNVGAAVGTPGIGQLAAYFNTDGSVDVGPFYALVQYPASAILDISKVDTTIYISKHSYSVSTMDTWFSSQPLSNDIQFSSPGAGNVCAFTFTNDAGPQGFYIRTGLPGHYHYARVLLESASGGIIQTSSQGFKYIEMEISYQTQPNLPYAKSNTRVATPAVSGISTVRR